jgi:hypothetical protein
VPLREAITVYGEEHRDDLLQETKWSATKGDEERLLLLARNARQSLKSLPRPSGVFGAVPGARVVVAALAERERATAPLLGDAATAVPTLWL